MVPPGLVDGGNLPPLDGRLDSGQPDQSPGDARSDLWFTYWLGVRLKKLYADSTLPRDQGFTNLRNLRNLRMTSGCTRTKKLFHPPTSFILSLNPISYCRFKHINVYVF